MTSAASWDAGRQRAVLRSKAPSAAVEEDPANRLPVGGPGSRTSTTGCRSPASPRPPASPQSDFPAPSIPSKRIPPTASRLGVAEPAPVTTAIKCRPGCGACP